MLIIQIALGIILALLLLVWFPIILGFVLLLIPIILILGLLAFGLSFMPEEWIYFLENNWIFPVIILGVFLFFFLGFPAFRRNKLFRRTKKRKAYKFLVNRILFVEKVFGGKSAQNIMDFISFITFYISCLALTLASPFLLLAILKLFA
jgi:hypothetical protein